MKIVYFTLVLNNHQANVADELWEQTGHQYRFVELANLGNEHKKGDTRDYSECPYLIRAWESAEMYTEAMEMAKTADACVFGGGVLSLPFMKERLKLNKLSFDASERWMKRGFKNMLSPSLLKLFLAYKVGNWDKKHLYKLCNSAFAANDHKKVGMYRNKCYKWGYFTSVARNEKQNENSHSADSINQKPPTITLKMMWCARFLIWKHPELPILLAERLKKNGYRFHLDMYGEGEYKQQAVDLVESLGLTDCVSFIGNKPNTELLKDMQQHEIFLFTSDKNEGWGAVANESMSNGCVLVASDTIGSTPYLVQDGLNGFNFKSSKTTCSFNNPDMEALDSLYGKVIWLLERPEERNKMQQNAIKTMHKLWSPANAAKSLLTLTEDLLNGKDTSITDGPCSKA